MRRKARDDYLGPRCDIESLTVDASALEHDSTGAQETQAQIDGSMTQPQAQIRDRFLPTKY
jgi:hypothetical protein